jgi:hypothetical protein
MEWGALNDPNPSFKFSPYRVEMSREVVLSPGETLTVKCSKCGGNALNSESEYGMPTLTKNLLAQNQSSNLQGGKRRTRKASQTGGKKAPNGYMKFAAEIRPQILKEHPEMKSDVVQVAREIGKKWRALTESERKNY